MKFNATLIGMLCLACIIIGLLGHNILFPPPKPQPVTVEMLRDTTWERDLTGKIDNLDREIKILSKKFGRFKTVDTFYIGDSTLVVDTNTILGSAPVIEESFGEQFIDYIDNKPVPRDFLVVATYQGFLHNLTYTFKPLNITSPVQSQKPRLDFWGEMDLMAFYDSTWTYGGGLGIGIKVFDRVSPYIRGEYLSDLTGWHRKGVLAIRGHLW